jgi:hypothetical protein
MAKPAEASAKAVSDLGLSAPVQAVLSDIQKDLAGAYRDRFIEMAEALRRQASALDRIQTTLAVLVKHIAPKLEGEIPVALRIAPEGESPDLASTIVVADPIGAGYTLSQSDLAKALDVSQADVSILVRGFKIVEDGDCAVVVRRGHHHRIVNFHPRSVARFVQLVLQPPEGLDRDQRSALTRVRKKLKPT